MGTIIFRLLFVVNRHSLSNITLEEGDEVSIGEIPSQFVINILENTTKIFAEDSRGQRYFLPKKELKKLKSRLSEITFTEENKDPLLQSMSGKFFIPRGPIVIPSNNE